MGVFYNMYIVCIHISEKETQAFEFVTMELAEQFCLAVTQAKDVLSAIIYKHGVGKNLLILGTYAQGHYLG